MGIDDIGNALVDVARAGVSLATGDVHGARAHLSDADSAITGDTTNSDIAAAEARRQHDAGVGEHQRDELGVQQAALTRGVRGGFDGRAVTNFENYAAFDHPELYAKAQKMKTAPLQETATTWTTTGGSVKSTFEALGQSLSSAIANGWEGDGASAATATSARYVRHASALQPAFALTGSKLQEAASGVGETNATLPPPVEFNRTHAVLHGVVSMLSGGAADADVKAQQGAMDAAHAEAVQVMESTYKPVMASADSGVPTFAAPSSPTTGDLAPTQPPAPGDSRTPGSAPWFPQTRPGVGSTGGGPNGGSTAGSTWSQPRAGQISPAGTPTAGSGGPGDRTGSGSGGYGEPAAAVSSAGYTAPGFGSGSGYGGAGQAAGAAAGYGSGGYGGAGDAAGYGAGGFGGTGSDARGGTAGLGGAGGSEGSRGYGSGASGSGSSGSGGSSGVRGGGALGGGTGATGAGPGGGAAGGAAGATGASPGTGTRGVAGSGGARSGAAGGMGGGRGGRGEEDYEHDTPSYLITDDNGSEIVGTLPPVAPAVIGE